MKFLFICEFNKKIGLGHLNRCLNFANFLISNNHDCSLFCINSDLGLIKLFNFSKKINFIRNENNLLSKDNLSRFEYLIKKKSFDCVVIDHYKVNYNLQKKISKLKIFTICIADFSSKNYYCDILINPNSPKKFKNKKKNSVQLCGNEYSFIENSFFKKDLKKYKKSNDILIYLGSNSKVKFLNKFLIKLSKSLTFKPKFKIISFVNIKLKIPNVTRLKFQSTKKLIKQIDKSSIIISAGGTFLVKCILRKRLIIALSTNKNQNENLKYLAKKKLIILVKNREPFFNKNTFKKKYLFFKKHPSNINYSKFENSKKILLKTTLKLYKDFKLTPN